MSLRRLRDARRRLGEWIRFGKITSRVVETAGDHVVAEVEYRGRFDRVVGYWAYGYFDPSLPYHPEDT